MVECTSAPWLERPTAQAVADSTGATAIAVHGGVWARVAPQLPPELAAMVAPPICVSSAPVAIPTAVDNRRRAELTRYRTNMPPAPAFDRHRQPARTAP